MSAHAPSLGSMRSSVVRGVAWKATSQIALQVTRILVAVILARLLAPHDYGLAGMVLVFSSLILVVSDLGLGAALVQRAELSERDRSTAFWTSAAVGVALAGLGIALSGPIAAFYGEPMVRPLFAALSVGFLLSSLATTQAALLTRRMDFRALELRMILATLAGAVVGIAAAARGAGAWAIIVQQLTVTAVSTTLLWLFSPWRPRLYFSRASLKSLGGFGANVFGTNVCFYLNRNVDNLLIGRFLGAAALGVYGLAYNVMLLPLSRLAVPLQDVLFPALSRMQDDPARIATVWIRVTRLVAAISAPAMLGLVVVAHDFVVLVLGERWRAAVPVIQILACVGLLQSLSTLNPRILAALDRTRLLLRFSIFSFALYLTAFVVGLRFGIVGVAAAYAASVTLIGQPLFAWLTARCLGVTPLVLLRGIAGVVQAAAAMAVLVLGVRLLLVREGVPAGARLAILVALGTAVYLPLCAWRAPEVPGELRRLHRRRARRTAPAADAAVRPAGGPAS